MSPDIAILESGMVLGGVFCTLGGFGIVRVSRDRTYSPRHLRLLGGLMLLGAVVLPQLADCGTYGRFAVISALVFGAAFAVYCVRTWRRSPPVRWPHTVVGWLDFALDALNWTGVVAGMIEYFAGPRWAGLLVPCAMLGIAIARTLDVWIARQHS